MNCNNMICNYCEQPIEKTEELKVWIHCKTLKVCCNPGTGASYTATPKELETPKKVLHNPTPKYYRFSFKGIKLDPYRIAKVYNITHPTQFHIIKKALRAGESVKDLKQDIKEIRDSCDRWLEMIEEDQ